MAIDNFFKGIDVATKGVERAEKRRAAEKTAKSMADLGAQIKSSMLGSTDMGQLVGSATASGLVENALEGLKMLNSSPEKFTFDVGVRGIKDPDARAQYNKISKLFENNNFLKANGMYRAMRANGLGGGGKDKDGKDVKLEKIKVDLGKVIPGVVSKLNTKYKIQNQDGEEVSADKFSFAKNVYANPEYMDVTKGYIEDLETEIRNAVTQTYPEYMHKDAAGSREAAVNSIMSMIINSPDLSVLGKYQTTGTEDSGDRKQTLQWDFYDAQIPLPVLIDTYTQTPSAEDIGYSVEEEIIPEVKTPWYLPNTPEKRTIKIIKGRGKNKTTSGSGELDKIN